MLQQQHFVYEMLVYNEVLVHFCFKYICIRRYDCLYICVQSNGCLNLSRISNSNNNNNNNNLHTNTYMLIDIPAGIRWRSHSVIRLDEDHTHRRAVGRTRGRGSVGRLPKLQIACPARLKCQLDTHFI